MNRECRPINLLSFLEAENVRLREAAVDLLLDAVALRETLKRLESGERDATVSSQDQRPAPPATLVHTGSGPPSK
jgi:hypothetical protein